MYFYVILYVYQWCWVSWWWLSLLWAAGALGSGPLMASGKIFEAFSAVLWLWDRVQSVVDEIGGIVLALIQMEERPVHVDNMVLRFPQRNSLMFKSISNIFVNPASHKCQMSDCIESKPQKSCSPRRWDILGHDFTELLYGRQLNNSDCTLRPIRPPRSPK